jgi:AcrR family transcriptional regulator|nr:CerR family C-terminal domain-containing protein [uncultured Acidovorax sp.]
MSFGAPLIPAAQRTARSDGEDTRVRLLHAALQLFSERGFAQTSVRAIAEAAGTNVAAIAYHFGDKARLYTATFYEPFGSGSDLIPVFADPALTLHQALAAYFGGFLEPLKHDDLVTQSLRLHVRELLDPTHVWPELIERECRAPHLALVQVLGRHMGVAEADDDLHRLAFSLAGLVMQMWTQRDPLQAIAPQLAGSQAVDLWVDRLTGYALCMVQGEISRRRAAQRPARPTTPRTSRTSHKKEANA